MTPPRLPREHEALALARLQFSSREVGLTATIESLLTSLQYTPPPSFRTSLTPSLTSHVITPLATDNPAMAHAATMPPPRAAPELMIRFAVHIGTPRPAAIEDQPTQSTNGDDRRHSMLVPAESGESFGDLWSEIDRRWVDYGYDKAAPAGYFHRLESHDHAAIDHRDIVGTMYSRDMSSDERVLYVVRNTRDRLSSVAPNTSLRPDKYNRAALTEEQRADLLRQEQQHKSRSGSAAELDRDTPLPSLENGGTTAVQQAVIGPQARRLDVQGFTIPALPQSGRQRRGLAQTPREAANASSTRVPPQRSQSTMRAPVNAGEGSSTAQAALQGVSTTRKRKRRASEAAARKSRGHTVDTDQDVGRGVQSSTIAPNNRDSLIPTPPESRPRPGFSQAHPDSAQRPRASPSATPSTQRSVPAQSRPSFLIQSTAEANARDEVFLQDYPAIQDDDIEDDDELQVLGRARAHVNDHSEDEDDDERSHVLATSKSRPAPQSSGQQPRSSSGLNSSSGRSGGKTHRSKVGGSGSRVPRGSKVLWTRVEDDILRHAAENGTTAAALVKDGLITGRTASAIRGRTRLLVQKYGMKKHVQSGPGDGSSQPGVSRPSSSQPSSSQIQPTQHRHDQSWTQQEREWISRAIKDGKDASETKIPGRSADAVEKKFRRWQASAWRIVMDEHTYPDDSVHFEIWSAKDSCKLRRAVREDMSLVQLHQKYFRQWDVALIERKHKAYERQVKLLSGNASVNSTASSQQTDDAASTRTVGKMLRDLETALSRSAAPPAEQQPPTLVSSSPPASSPTDATAHAASDQTPSVPPVTTGAGTSGAIPREPRSQEPRPVSRFRLAPGADGQQTFDLGRGNGTARARPAVPATGPRRSPRQKRSVPVASQALTDPDELEAFHEAHFGSDVRPAVAAAEDETNAFAPQDGEPSRTAGQPDEAAVTNVQEDEMDNMDSHDGADTAAEDVPMLDAPLLPELTTPSSVRRVRATQNASVAMERMMDEAQATTSGPATAAESEVPALDSSQESSVAFQTQDPMNTLSQRLAREARDSQISRTPTTQDAPLCRAEVHAAKQQASLAQAAAVGNYDSTQSQNRNAPITSSSRARRDAETEPARNEPPTAALTSVLDKQDTVPVRDSSSEAENTQKKQVVAHASTSPPEQTPPTSGPVPVNGPPRVWRPNMCDGDVAWHLRKPVKSDEAIWRDLRIDHKDKWNTWDSKKRQRAFDIEHHNALVRNASMYDDENLQKALHIKAKKRCRLRRVEDGTYENKLRYGVEPRWDIVNGANKGDDVDDEVFRDNATEITDLSEYVQDDRVEFDSEGNEIENEEQDVESEEDMIRDRHVSEVDSDDEDVEDEDDQPPFTPYRGRAQQQSAAAEEEILYEDEDSIQQPRQQTTSRMRSNGVSGNYRQRALDSQLTDAPAVRSTSMTTSEARRHRHRRKGRNEDRRDSSSAAGARRPHQQVPRPTPANARLTTANMRRHNGEPSSTPPRASNMPPPPRRSPRNQANAAVEASDAQPRRSRPQRLGVQPMTTPMRNIIRNAVVPAVPTDRYATPRNNRQFLGEDEEQTSAGSASMSELKLASLAAGCILLGWLVTSSLGPTEDTASLRAAAVYDPASGGVMGEPTGYGQPDLVEEGSEEDEEDEGPSVKGALLDLHHAVTDKLQYWNPYASKTDKPGTNRTLASKTGSKAATSSMAAVGGETIAEGLPESERLGARTRVGKCTILFNGNSYWERAIRTHEQHDRMHGYRLHVLRQHLMDDVWSKPAYILSLLLREMAKPDSERLDWLFWVDADTVILNPYVPVEVFLPPPGPDFEDVNLLYSNDWNGLNNGVFPIRVNRWAVDLFSAIVSYRYYRPDDPLVFRDQSAMNTIMHEPKFKKGVVAAPQRWFNAYQGEHNETLAPFQVRRGDLLVHFAGVPNREERMGYWLERAEQHLDDWEVPLKSTSYPQERADFWNEYKESKKNWRSTVAETRQKASQVMSKIAEQMQDFGDRLTGEQKSRLESTRQELVQVLGDERHSEDIGKLNEKIEAMQSAADPLTDHIKIAQKLLLTSAHEAIFAGERDALAYRATNGQGVSEMNAVNNAIQNLKELIMAPQEQWHKPSILAATNAVTEARARMQERLDLEKAEQSAANQIQKAKAALEGQAAHKAVTEAAEDDDDEDSEVDEADVSGVPVQDTGSLPVAGQHGPVAAVVVTAQMPATTLIQIATVIGGAVIATVTGPAVVHTVVRGAVVATLWMTVQDEAPAATGEVVRAAQDEAVNA
ncbi:hypothetical protein LTR95_005888 [Oleoguttula sp. CCFEE 5521]